MPVPSVAAGLRQFDIHLDGIDIVSVKVRRGGNAAELSALEDWGPEEWDAGERSARVLLSAAPGWCCG